MWSGCLWVVSLLDRSQCHDYPLGFGKGLITIAVALHLTPLCALWATFAYKDMCTGNLAYLYSRASFTFSAGSLCYHISWLAVPGQCPPPRTRSTPSASVVSGGRGRHCRPRHDASAHWFLRTESSAFKGFQYHRLDLVDKPFNLCATHLGAHDALLRELLYVASILYDPCPHDILTDYLYHRHVATLNAQQTLYTR